MQGHVAALENFPLPPSPHPLISLPVPFKNGNVTPALFQVKKPCKKDENLVGKRGNQFFDRRDPLCSKDFPEKLRSS
jgi:hypothetical protein